MRNVTRKEKAAIKQFGLTQTERDMLTELNEILKMFHFATQELQSNKVSVSRVYPCVQYIRNGLQSKLTSCKYTTKLLEDLLASLEQRFGTLIEDDLFLVSTFLDPNFGLDAFALDKKSDVKSRVKTLLKQMSVTVESTKNNRQGEQAYLYFFQYLILILNL